MPSDPVIDIHNHVATPAVEAVIERHYSRAEITAREPYDLFAGAASIARNLEMKPTVFPKLTRVDERLRDMDAMRVDRQVLATYVAQFYYWTDGDLGQHLARLQNDNLAEIVRDHPDRFAALGTVPMQDTARAVAELEHVVDGLGFKGVQISSNVAGDDLDDPRFRPFFRRAAELGAVVLIHPNGFDQGRRLDDYWLINVIGNPLDTTIALTRMIFAGVFEELPDLKLVAVHGGGYLPYYSARMDHAWEVRPECRANIPQPPSTYLKRVYFDTMVFSGDSLAQLIEFAGVDHVLLGTDYPFDMGEADPLGFLRRQPGLGEAELARISGTNAAGLLGIS